MADGKSEVKARQLDAAQAITHVGSWKWTWRPDGTLVSLTVPLRFPSEREDVIGA